MPKKIMTPVEEILAEFEACLQKLKQEKKELQKTVLYVADFDIETTSPELEENNDRIANLERIKDAVTALSDDEQRILTFLRARVFSETRAMSDWVTFLDDFLEPKTMVHLKNSYMAFSDSAARFFARKAIHEPSMLDSARLVIDVAAEYCQNNGEDWINEDEAVEAAVAYIRAWNAKTAPPQNEKAEQKNVQYLYHPVLHVDDAYCYFSFPMLLSSSRNKLRLVAIDSNGDVFPVAKHGGRLLQVIDKVEKSFETWNRRLLPMELQNVENRIDILKSNLQINDNESVEWDAGMKGMLVWCLATFFYPNILGFRILRVLVNNIEIARKAQLFIEKYAFNVLCCTRDDVKTEIDKHRKNRAGVVLFGYKRSSGRLPNCVDSYLEDIPRAERHEPPIAMIETTAGPPLPRDWCYQVTLNTQPRHDYTELLGYAMPLHMEILRKMKTFDELEVELWRLLFNEKPKRTFRSEKDWIDDLVSMTWNACRKETTHSSTVSLECCNPKCMLNRLDLRTENWFTKKGWTDRTVIRNLRKLGIIRGTGQKNIKGCLSEKRSEELKNRGLAWFHVER